MLERNLKSINELVFEKVTRVKEASKELGAVSSEVRNSVLNKIARELKNQKGGILRENSLDVELAKKNGKTVAFIDRLKLDEKRIKGMIKSLQTIARMDDCLDETIEEKKLENRLLLKKIRVPIGVIGVIYESRPDVTIEATALCIKTGNCIILKGGSEAIRTNIELVNIVKGALKKGGLSESCVELIESNDRRAVAELLKLYDFIDLIIPRGSEGLIKFVRENSKIPVIASGGGNCHIYVDEYADLEMATKIIINAKTQRPSTCNAVEKLLLHKNIAESYLPIICEELSKSGVKIKGDERSKKIMGNIELATEDDWYSEYSDLIIAIKIVNSADEAIEHINKYSTKHTESIITSNKKNAEKFFREIDSACIFQNASTRLTDGGQFGMGGEIGISTQKLHARGPMALKELTTTKWIGIGNGQIRE